MKNKIAKGLTNKLRIKNDLLYKRSNEIVDYYIDRENEKTFYDQIKNQQINFIIQPIDYYFTKTNTFESVYQYLENIKTFNDLKKYSISHYKKVSELINNLHQLKLNLKQFNPQKFLNLFKNKVEPIFELEKYDLQIAEIINNYYDLDAKIVVSHNDLVKGNFLQIKNEWKLIDFEMVNMNHYLFDYASFATESCNQKQANSFIKFLCLNPKQESKINELMLYQNYLWAYWAKYMYLKTNKKVYFKIMQEKIEKANWK